MLYKIQVCQYKSIDVVIGARAWGQRMAGIDWSIFDP